MAAFRPLPLGARIPASPHAVSCSLPTMRDVCGYEENDPDILRAVTSGYPRFVVHPFATALNAHVVGADPALEGRTLWLTSSARMAGRLAEYLGPADEPRRFERDRVHGVSHRTDGGAASRAKRFLQHVGGFLSSREAEDHLVRLGLRDAVVYEAVFEGDGIGEVVRQLRPNLPGTDAADIVVTNCGMSAVDTAFRAVAALQAPRGRTAWLQKGWLYLDTIAILQTFTASPVDYIAVPNALDTRAIARAFDEHGHRLAGVVAEVPTNPLVQTPDVEVLRAHCDRSGARLVIDPSIASVFVVDVLAHADLVVSSLTKYTASAGDLVAGVVAVNPAGPDAGPLRDAVAERHEPLYARDAARLAHEMGDTAAVLARIHDSTPRVAAYLEAHPAVRDVFWARHPGSAASFSRVARTSAATGGLISVTLREPGSLARVYDRLRLPKGPSFGMTTTLVCPFMYLAHYDLVRSQAGRAALAADGLDPDLLRLCVGTEPVDDIIAALGEALG